MSDETPKEDRPAGKGLRNNLSNEHSKEDQPARKGFSNNLSRVHSKEDRPAGKGLSNLSQGAKGKPAPATGIRHFIRSCCYTANGLREACKESAFRQELLLGVVLIPLSWLLHFPPMVAVFLDCMWFFLLVTELLNTSIEAIVDLASPGYHELAKRSKDLASAAVGLAIIANVFVWGAAVVVFFF